MHNVSNPSSMLRMGETKQTDAPPRDDGARENLLVTTVRVEFTCPEGLDLAGLQVFDADDREMAPVRDEKTDEEYPGVYNLQPGEYYYVFRTDSESYRDIEHEAFTVERGKKDMTVQIVPEEVQGEETQGEETQGEDIPGEETPEEEASEDSETGEPDENTADNAGEEDGSNSESDAEAITQEPTKMVAEPAPEPAEAENRGPGLWGGALIGLLIGAALGCVVMRLIQKQVRRKNATRGAKLHIQARAVQGIGARQDQQDALYMSDGRLYEQQGILMCVADGMGGLSDGAKISRAAVSAVEQGFGIQEKDNPERLVFTLTKQALDAVNQTVSPNFGSGGSTMVLGYLRKGEFTFTSVGDSRISLYRDGSIWHLNRRHVYEDELKVRALNGGMTYETATMDKKKGALTSYLGMGMLKYTDMPDARIALRRGDRLILMSDGVFNTIPDEELAAILSRKIDAVTGEIAERIKAKASRYQDNFTAIVVAVE